MACVGRPNANPRRGRLSKKKCLRLEQGARLRLEARVARYVERGNKFKSAVGARRYDTVEKITREWIGRDTRESVCIKTQKRQERVKLHDRVAYLNSRKCMRTLA
jgi:hypothetical protein